MEFLDCYLKLRYFAAYMRTDVNEMSREQMNALGLSSSTRGGLSGASG